MRPAMDRQLAGLRIGAYARFSSDKQSETSATAQIARLRQWVQARGGHFCLRHTYRDEGISGATNERPGLISLMAAVDSRELDVVVVEDLLTPLAGHRALRIHAEAVRVLGCCG